MLHPDTALASIDGQGYGVVATEHIPRGTVVWVQDSLDRLLSVDRVAGLPPLLRAAVRNHGYFDREGRIVLCWDHARYVNHSCEPNCVSPGHAFEIAVRDIEAGEQLTNDYLTLNLECDFECQCRRPTFRRVLAASRAEDLADHWDGLIRVAVPAVPSVPQPLQSVMGEDDGRALDVAVQGARPLRSCRWHLSPSLLSMPR